MEERRHQGAAGDRNRCGGKDSETATFLLWTRKQNEVRQGPATNVKRADPREQA